MTKNVERKEKRVKWSEMVERKEKGRTDGGKDRQDTKKEYDDDMTTGVREGRKRKKKKDVPSHHSFTLLCECEQEFKGHLPSAVFEQFFLRDLEQHPGQRCSHLLDESRLGTDQFQKFLETVHSKRFVETFLGSLPSLECAW